LAAREIVLNLCSPAEPQKLLKKRLGRIVIWEDMLFAFLWPNQNCVSLHSAFPEGKDL